MKISTGCRGADGIRMTYSREFQGMDLDTKRGDIFLLEFACQVALDKSCL